MLEKIVEALQSKPGKMLIAWIAPITHPLAKRISRLEFTAMLAAGVDKEGVPRVARMYGTVSQGRTGAIVKFLDEGLVRITDGPRKGMVVEEQELAEAEAGVPAGLRKKLVYGGTAGGIRKHMKQDMELVDTLTDLIGRPKMRMFRIPELLLMTSGTPRLRSCEEARKALMELPGYSEQAGTRWNMTRIGTGLAESLSGGRWLYPFEYVYGSGSVVFAVDNIGGRGVWVDSKSKLVTDTFMAEPAKALNME